MFEAKIIRLRVRGETFFNAAVFFGGRAVFQRKALPSKSYAQLEVLEWAQRHGKTELLNWQYLHK